MNSFKKYLRALVLFFVLILAAWGFVDFYPYLFAQKIEGQIEKVERVELGVSLIQNGGASDTKINPQLYSFAVAIKTAEGKIWTASAEDRQWASMSTGTCVKAKFFPYPPWRMDKSGTYYGARLLEAWDCSKAPSN